MSFPVYITRDDTSLAWKDPIAFKKFAIGPLIADLPIDERKAALDDWWKLSPEEIIAHRDTADTYDVFDSDIVDDEGNKLFDENDPDINWDITLKDLYNGAEDVFDGDLYKLLEDYTPEQDSTGSINDKPSEEVSDENKKTKSCVSDESVKNIDSACEDSGDCKSEDEPENKPSSGKINKEQELSDMRFKNIVNTLIDRRW